MPHAGGGVRHWNHHDRRPPLRLRGDFGRESRRAQRREEILGQRRGHLSKRRHADLLDVLETTELGVYCGKRGRAHLEAARVVVKRQGAGIERELIALAEPTGDAWLEM